jgi:hypothetical protein
MSTEILLVLPVMPVAGVAKRVIATSCVRTWSVRVVDPVRPSNVVTVNDTW